MATYPFVWYDSNIDLNKEFNAEGHPTDLEGDVASGQETAAQIVVQTLKADRSYTFKKKGHEEQYRLNADIEGYFNKAQAEAGKIQPATEKEQKSMVALKNQLKEGIQAITCCQKRIKVADRQIMDGRWSKHMIMMN